MIGGWVGLVFAVLVAHFVVANLVASLLLGASVGSVRRR